MRDEEPVALLGVPMGGAVALRTAAMRPDVDAVISVSTFASVDRMIRDFMAMMGLPKPLVGLMAPFARLALLTVYGVWPATASPLHDIATIPSRPILLLHGTADDQVPAEHARLLARAGNGQAILQIIEGADHCIFETLELTTPLDRDYVRYIFEFLSRIPQ